MKNENSLVQKFKILKNMYELMNNFFKKWVADFNDYTINLEWFYGGAQG